MNKRLFERMVESMEQRGEIARGERAPSREFYVGEGCASASSSTSVVLLVVHKHGIASQPLPVKPPSSREARRACRRSRACSRAHRG